MQKRTRYYCWMTSSWVMSKLLSFSFFFSRRLIKCVFVRHQVTRIPDSGLNVKKCHRWSTEIADSGTRNILPKHSSLSASLISRVMASDSSLTTCQILNLPGGAVFASRKIHSNLQNKNGMPNQLVQIRADAVLRPEKESNSTVAFSVVGKFETPGFRSESSSIRCFFQT